MVGKYLTKIEVSAQIEEETGLPVAPSTLDLWNKHGNGPRRVKVFGRVLFPSDGVDQFIAAIQSQLAGEDADEDAA